MSRSQLKCLECKEAMGSESICAKCGWTYAPDSAPKDSDYSLQIGSSEAIVSPPAHSQLLLVSSELAPPLTRSKTELWLEVVAVLTVGVIPHLASAIGWYYSIESTGSGNRFILIEFATRAVSSACVGYATLYLIYRSGEPWNNFGITPFCMSDVVLATVFFIAASTITNAVLILVPINWEFSSAQHGAQTVLEFFVLVISDIINGFSEEIVCRAYLITRFEQLLKSQLKAAVIASTLFASYHLYLGVVGVLNALLIGLAYSGAFLLFRTLWPLGIGHACTNIYPELLWYGR